jgi:hypothetical protein
VIVMLNGPLTGVREHRPRPDEDGVMACAACDQPVYLLKFGVWLIWVSLESGQVCDGR